jgi:membrane protease YdiL (CAAX protease family)
MLDILNIASIPKNEKTNFWLYVFINVLGSYIIAIIVNIIFVKIFNILKSINYQLCTKKTDTINTKYKINSKFEDMYNNNIKPIEYIISGIWSSIYAGITEELTFRFLLMNVIFLQQLKLKPIIAIILSSFIFGLTHMINIKSQNIKETFIQSINAFSSGILDGFIYYKTGNLGITIISHIIYDMIIMILSGIEYYKYYNEKEKEKKGIDLNTKKVKEKTNNYEKYEFFKIRKSFNYNLIIK